MRGNRERERERVEKRQEKETERGRERKNGREQVKKTLGNRGEEMKWREREEIGKRRKGRKE